MDGTAKDLVTKVGQLVGKEFQQLRGVGGQVARLKNELGTMNALLRMQSEADEASLDHFAREWMKQLREVAYDAEDRVDLYLFRVRSRPGDRTFVWCKRLLTTLWSRHCLATDIRALRALASSINEQHARYGASLESLLRSTATSDRPPSSAAPALCAAAADGNNPTQFVANMAKAEDLAKKVSAADDDKDKKRKVFSIVGFGGLGKTTLAMEVCRQLETKFQRQAQVSVSQTFSGKDLEGLLKRVLRQIAQPKQTTKPVDTTTNTEDAEASTQREDPLVNIDAAGLEHELKKRLENERYLILIDDVWSIAAWNAIQSKLPSSNCGSRIIVTTRIDTVAKACSDANDEHIHYMEKLHDEESKKLFISKAFGARKTCPKDLEDVMTSILKRCGGLPLAIVSIASLLASYKSPEGKEMWELIQRSIGSQLENNPTLEGMRQLLTLSYNHLPHHLKACMMYVSIFPEDHMISKDRLLKRWIAEGFVAEKRGLTQMEIAEGYFSELISRSMIDRADGKEERCRVHDMMLEILVSKSLEANFVSLIGGQYEGMSYDTTIRRLSIHENSSSKNNRAARRGTGNNNGIKGMVVHHVRSLSIFDPEPEANRLLARLGDFTLLRVLDLEDCKGLTTKHINCVCRMYLLRFLSLKGTDIKVMPRRVGDLEHLQTLDVRQTHLLDLPKAVKNLVKLEHLLLSNKGSTWWCGYWRLPQGINKMKALRQLSNARIYDSEVAGEIGELDQLQELAIYVDTRKGKDVRKGKDSKVLQNLACSLGKMYSLRRLDIGNFSCHKWPFKPIMDFLHGVKSPPRLLRYLRICGHFCNGLPEWVGSLNHLAELEIEWTYLNGARLFNVLYKLPNLERLFLGVYFIRKGEDMVAGSSQPFPKLKELTLGYSPEVPPVYRFEQGSMPNLKKLVVNFGDQGKQIVGIEHLVELEEVQYNGGKSLMKHEVDKLEDLIKKRPKITVRVRYDDDM